MNRSIKRNYWSILRPVYLSIIIFYSCTEKPISNQSSKIESKTKSQIAWDSITVSTTDFNTWSRMSKGDTVKILTSDSLLLKGTINMNHQDKEEIVLGIQFLDEHKYTMTISKPNLTLDMEGMILSNFTNDGFLLQKKDDHYRFIHKTKQEIIIE